MTSQQNLHTHRKSSGNNKCMCYALKFHTPEHIVLNVAKPNGYFLVLADTTVQRATLQSHCLVDNLAACKRFIK